MKNRNDGLRATPAGWDVLRSLVAPHKGLVALLALASVASAALEATFIVLLTAIGMALVGGSATVGPVLGSVISVQMALVLAGVALVLRVALSLWGVRVSARLTATVTSTQRRQLAESYLRSNWAVQQAEPSGRLQELLTSFVARISNTVNTLAAAITASLSLAAFLAAGLVMDPLSTGAVLIALAVVGGILTPLRRAIRRRSRRNAQAGLAFANAVSELGSLGLEMQTYGAQSHFEDRIESLNQTAVVTQQRTQEYQGALPHIYMSLAYGAVLCGVAVVSVSGITNLTVVGAVMLLMLRSLSYGQQLAATSASIAGHLPFLESVRDMVQRYTAAAAPQGSQRPAGVVPLDVRNASFAYTPDRVALSEVSFRLHPGEAIGVIGPSGAGKSTIAQLLLGLRQPTAGTIESAGVPLTEVDRRWWTSRVAFVAQDAQLFTGTVAENIRFFRNEIGDERLREAASHANILADIESLPNGFDTHLGERGSQLSGGQRQRLSIARALVGRPELLILDEPTSALDGQSEALIRDTLSALRGRMSVVLIAHRMSTLDICDRIMVVEDGQMTALDTPMRLRANNEFYRTALAVAGIS